MLDLDNLIRCLFSYVVNAFFFLYMAFLSIIISVFSLQDLPDDVIFKKIMESSFDSTTKILMTVNPLITHKARKNMCAILYDEDTGVLDVASGVRFLAYYRDDGDKRMFSFTEEHLKKRVVLKGKVSPVRALVVTGEGNFLSVLVRNTL